MKLVGDNLRYCLPLIYTPTVGTIIKNYCDIIKDDRGTVITYFPPEETWIDDNETIGHYLEYI